MFSRIPLLFAFCSSYLGLMLSQVKKDFGVKEDRKEKRNYDYSNKLNKCFAVAKVVRIQEIHQTSYNCSQKSNEFVLKLLCLYLNPSNSARNLSTLMAVAVARKVHRRWNSSEAYASCHLRSWTRQQKRLNNNDNTKIRHSQAAEQKLCRRMNRRNIVKRNEDQSVVECWCESEKNVERKKEYKEWSLINLLGKIDLGFKSFDVHKSSWQFWAP